MTGDIEGMMDELAAAQTAGRTRLDRYRDFRDVFLGSATGKKVLHDIIAMGAIYRSSVQSDPYQLFRAAGERNMALKILATVMVEPLDRPQRQQSKPKNEGE